MAQLIHRGIVPFVMLQLLTVAPRKIFGFLQTAALYDRYMTVRARDFLS